MKKLMKAIAFATVMCMLLSTAAFAAIEEPVVDTDTKTLNITINEVGANEQVSLLILKTTANLASIGEGDILYINQTESTASNTASFTAVLDTDEDAVAIYSGSATYAAGSHATAYQYLGDVEITAAVTEVALVVKEAASVVADKVQTEAKDYYATALKMTVNFTAIPAGYKASKMIWAIQTSEGRKYTPVIDAAWLAAIDTNTDIAFGVAFDNGSVKQGITPLTVTGGDMIFKFVKAGEADKEAFTNPTVDNKDAARK